MPTSARSSAQERNDIYCESLRLQRADEGHRPLRNTNSVYPLNSNLSVCLYNPPFLKFFEGAETFSQKSFCIVPFNLRFIVGGVYQKTILIPAMTMITEKASFSIFVFSLSVRKAPAIPPAIPGRARVSRDTWSIFEVWE